MKFKIVTENESQGCAYALIGLNEKCSKYAIFKFYKNMHLQTNFHLV